MRTVGSKQPQLTENLQSFTEPEANQETQKDEYPKTKAVLLKGLSKSIGTCQLWSITKIEGKPF